LIGLESNNSLVRKNAGCFALSLPRGLRNVPITASAIRFKAESALVWKIPSALTPQPKMVRPVMETGIAPLDDPPVADFCRCRE
jgi:hypothetical protein